MAGLCLAQTGDLVPPEVRRIGDRLACLCGSCKNTVATCTMLGCHYSAPTRQKISQLHKEGKTDDEVVAAIVKENGKQALSVPPAEGFGLAAWLMPPIAALAGLGFVAWFIRRNRKPAGADTAPALTDAEVEKYRLEAERDLDRFDEE